MTARSQDAGVEQAWRRFAPDLRRFVERRVATPADAEDIVQLVFLRMAERFDPAGEERTAAWLYTTTRNAITDHYRSAVRRREVPTGQVVVDEPAPEPEQDDHAAEAELAQCLVPLIRQLPADQAEALELVDLAGSTQAAAARTAGVTLPGMKSRVQRGRRRLRELLQECCDVERDVRGRVMEFAPAAGQPSSAGADCAGCGPQ